MEGKSPKLIEALAELEQKVGMKPTFKNKSAEVTFYSPQGEVKGTGTLPEKAVFMFIPDWVVVEHYSRDNWSEVNGTWMLESEAKAAISDFLSRVLG